MSLLRAIPTLGNTVRLQYGARPEAAPLLPIGCRFTCPGRPGLIHSLGPSLIRSNVFWLACFANKGQGREPPIGSLSLYFPPIENREMMRACGLASWPISSLRAFAGAYMTPSSNGTVRVISVAPTQGACARHSYESGQVRYVFFSTLGPRPQTSSRDTYYPKHTSYLLLWATYISEIEFNPFRAIFVYCQRQRSSGLSSSKPDVH